MTYNSKIMTVHSKFGIQRWRKGFILGLIFALGIVNYGCDKEEQESLDEYYVRYEVESSTVYTGLKLDVTITSEDNSNRTIVIDARKPWETVIGPVEKDFSATLAVSAKSETFDKLKLFPSIHVSKNDSPFALKKIDDSDERRDYVEIKYTIDY